MEKDDDGYTPLHLSLVYDAHELVVMAILEANAEAGK